jgi:hypothetical protein
VAPELLAPPAIGPTRFAEEGPSVKPILSESFWAKSSEAEIRHTPRSTIIAAIFFVCVIWLFFYRKNPSFDARLISKIMPSGGVPFTID